MTQVGQVSIALAQARVQLISERDFVEESHVPDVLTKTVA